MRASLRDEPGLCSCPRGLSGETCVLQWQRVRALQSNRASTPREGQVTLSVEESWRGPQPRTENARGFFLTIYHCALNIQQSEK